MADTILKGVTLKGLEVFEGIASTGSVAATAARLSMSAPAVSQQLKNLDAALGVELIDHSRRPMRLTPAGRTFLKRVEAALAALRAGQRDLVVLDLSGLSSLRLGMIEDFENEVTPILTERLSETMQNCAFRLRMGASHVLHGMLESRELDIAICAAGPEPIRGMIVHPLVIDPYILAVPRGTDVTGGFASLENLTFLRRDSDQVMGKTIEHYLSRQGLAIPRRFELESNQSISALVAGGTGWTITTPLSLLRAGRFSGGIDAHLLPDAPEPREIVLLATEEWSADLPAQIAAIARELIGLHFTGPGLQSMPWLSESFRVAG